MAAGVPRTLPSAATTATARCPTLTSTATTGCRRSSSSGGAGRGRGLPGCVDVPAAAYRVAGDVVAEAPVAACAATSSPGRRTATGPTAGSGRAAGSPGATAVPGSLTSSQPSSGCQRIVSFPHGLSFSPSAVRNSRAASHCARHCASVEPGGGEAGPLAQQRPAAPHHRHCPRLQLPLHPGQAGLQRVEADHLGVPLRWRRVPARPAWLPARRDGEPCLDPADPGLQACPRRTQVPFGQARTWSSLVRVIAPAHRDDDLAVSARFRAARETARPFASSRPSAHRAARSPPASDPRWLPAARSTASSCGDTRSRVRTRAPAGAAATNGAAIGPQPAHPPPPHKKPRAHAHPAKFI